MSGEGGAIAEVLAAHVQVTGYNEIGVWFNYACSCSAFGDSDEWHREHVAEALADLLAAERQRGREEALREAADGYLDCLCGHEIEWHHEERGCQYLGNNPQRRCRCLRDAHTAVGDRLRALADVPAAAEGERE